ncbi:MAG: DNA alkylation repair protein [Chloroflexi bacterium]|nr:DNA alkylation repair protein [Chloroflexota bacterium]
MSDSTLFKDNMNAALAQRLAEHIQAVYPSFDAAGFVGQIAPQLPPRELKERVAVFSAALHDFLPPDYGTAVTILLQILPPETPPEDGIFNGSLGWALWSVAHFVEVYGLDDLELSLTAMHTITKSFSCEFAIRPFLVRYPAHTLAALQAWATDPSPHVRRLVSEGTRPRLPWGMRLQQFIADPTPTLALLEQLKDDPSDYVRRSVANHLNDISKDNPELALATLARWNAGEPSAETAWITRHALRSLVKAGHPAALALQGFGAAQVSLSQLVIEPTAVQLGESLTVRFSLHNDTAVAQNLVIDYVVHFVKANGRTAPKVFKLKTAVLPPHADLTVQKRHAIKPITTRRYYPGRHRLEIQVNGQIIGGDSFELLP